MIFNELPKITKIAIPEGYSLTTDEFKLSNYKVTAFLVETIAPTEQPTLTIKARGFDSLGNAQDIRFLIRKSNLKEFQEIEPTGKVITMETSKSDSYLIAVTADMLSHENLVGVSLNISATVTGLIKTAYVLQTQPRDSTDDE